MSEITSIEAFTKALCFPKVCSCCVPDLSNRKWEIGISRTKNVNRHSQIFRLSATGVVSKLSDNFWTMYCEIY